MFKMLGAAVAAVAFACAGSAGAAVIVDISGSGLYYSGAFNLPDGPGKYRIEATSTAPAFIEFEAYYLHHWDVFVAPPPRDHGEYLEGNSEDVWKYADTLGTELSYDFIVPETTYSYGIAGNQYDYAGVVPGTPIYTEARSERPYIRFRASPDGVEDFDWRFTISTISAVPEPATWAMMIAGFGLAGAALRRRPVRARA